VKILTVVIIAMGMLALVSSAAMANAVYKWDDNASDSYAILYLNTSNDTVTVTGLHNIPAIQYPLTGVLREEVYDYCYTEGYGYLSPYIALYDDPGGGTIPMEAWGLETQLYFAIDPGFWGVGLLQAAATQELIETAITGWTLPGYGTTQYDLLAALYAAGTGTQVIGDITWEYSASGTKGVNGTNLYGYDYFIGLGSGLGGNEGGGGVPEPATVVGLVLAAMGMIARRRLLRRQV
jgi:hypothetical protein